MEQEMEVGEKGVVCVTGGTGFVASWLIMRLLQHGYSVRATIRSDPECKKDISYLINLPGASKKLEIFNADLDKPESFDEVIQGCIGVFHVAHPVDFEDREPQETVTNRSITGTLGILKACLNSKTVKRVVYTSSASALVFNKEALDMVDENSWSDVDFLRDELKPYGASYMISKTSTERAALEYAQKHGLDLVTLIPTFVVGPFLCPALPGSVYTAMAMIFGKSDQYQYLTNTSMVHIDDVASAHIFLLECPNAKGRYICSSQDVTILRMSEFLSAKYPEFQIPSTEYLKEIKGYRISSPSSKKLLDSGFKYNYGLDEMYDGAIQCCKKRGIL